MLADPSLDQRPGDHPDRGRSELVSSRGRIEAIDGLRAIAVLAVIAFHIDGWLPGGYLGVSVFFTISGFVIGRNLFAEHDRSGTIRLGGFYGRRVRRLLPASLVCIVAVVVAQRVFGAFDPIATRDEIPWVLLPVYNWHQLLQQHSYADIFRGAQSPFIHYWSLAIEEQVYLVVPVAVLLLLNRVPSAARRQRVLVAVTLALAVVPLATFAAAGPQGVYFATWSRLAEVMVGVLLAWWVGRHPLPAWIPRAGVAALAAVVVAMVVTPSGEQAWAYRGGLPVLAAATAVILAACATPGPVQRWLRFAPLTYLGRISYGIYLIHWPIALIVADQLPGAAAPVRMVLITAAAIAVAALSFHGFEQRILARSLPTWRTLTAAVAVSAAVLVGAWVVLPVERLPTTDVAAYDAARTAAVALQAAPPTPDATTNPVTTPDTASTAAPVVHPAQGGAAARPQVVPTAAATTTVAARRPMRVILTGDSTAVGVGEGAVDYLASHPGNGEISVTATGGCGLLTGGELSVDYLNRGLQVNCPLALEQTRQLAAAAHPDAVVAMVSLIDVWPRSWDHGQTWVRPMDEEFNRRLRADYGAFVDALLPNTACVVIVRGADSAVKIRGRFVPEESFRNGSRAALDQVVADLVAAHPGRMAVLDLNEWFDGSRPPGDDGRPDGIHPDQPTAAAIAERWLWPRLTDAGVGTGPCSTPARRPAAINPTG